MENEFTRPYLESLAHKWKDGTITEQEQAIFDAWYNEHEDGLLELPESYGAETDIIRLRMLKVIQEKQKASVTETKILHMPIPWLRYASVAAMLFLIGAFSYLHFYPSASTQADTLNTKVINISPGSNRATLTLADGSTISLDQAQVGAIAVQSGIHISKTTEGRIIYQEGEGNIGTQQYNTIKTPMGGQYQIQLPDGTKVWLNAASSLKYPASFRAQSDRLVELDGEAYFEVAHNAAQPFRVKSATQTVEVLGTHFNVNSYDNGTRTVTTLEQGSVKVSSAAISKKIIPGEQAINNSGKITIQDADLETALAWKNGEILFRNADVKTIMEQVARWYNIEVQYQGDIPPGRFDGGISRNSNLSTLLIILEQSNIHFAIKEKKDGKGKILIVKP